MSTIDEFLAKCHFYIHQAKMLRHDAKHHAGDSIYESTEAKYLQCCKDLKGMLHKVSELCLQHGCEITQLQSMVAAAGVSTEEFIAKHSVVYGMLKVVQLKAKGGLN